MRAEMIALLVLCTLVEVCLFIGYAYAVDRVVIKNTRARRACLIEESKRWTTRS